MSMIIPEAVRIERERFDAERAVAERAYDAAQMIIDSIGTKRWLSPGEFIDLVVREAGVSIYYAQMALSDFRSQGLVESVLGLGVRALSIDSDFEEKSPTLVAAEPIPYVPYYGTAHWDY